jgi:predicted dehydrogenase
MDRQIDGVVIASTDHTRAIAAITAIKVGKHVYCEKAAPHSVHEVRG